MEILIKYSNRKLYSKSDKTYVNLDYVKGLVKGNRTFVVVDHDSGLDITKDILKKLLLKVEAPRSSLERLIRMS